MIKNLLHKNGKNLLLMSLLLLSISFLVTPAIAQEQAVNVYPAHQEVDVGDIFTVTINVTDIAEPGVYAYELKLYYNSSLLTATDSEVPSDHFFAPDTTPGILIVDSGTIHEAEGYVSFAVTCIPPEVAKTGSGTLGIVTFEGIAVGESTLEFGPAGVDVIFADPAGEEIPGDQYLRNDGDVTVIPEFTTVVILSFFLITTLAAIILRKRARLI